MKTSCAPRKSHVYACRRCTQHKKRCQPTDGPCTNCSRARVECSRLTEPGCNPNGRPLVAPLRQALQHVEGELARLQSPGLAMRRGSAANSSDEPADYAFSGHPGCPDPDDTDCPYPDDTDCPDYARAALQHDDQQRYRFARQTAAAIGRSLTPAPGSRSGHAYYVARLYSGAELPFPLSVSRTHPPLPAPHEPILHMTPLLPPHVTERLLQVYIDRILPQCPIFHPTELQAIYRRLRSPPAPATGTDTGTDTDSRLVKGDTFIVIMAMAVATLTSKSDAYRKVAELAEALRVEAWQDAIEGQFLATTSIRSLQGLLLLAQYGLMMPQVVDLLHTACEAMRMAVEMGLHRDPPAAMGLSREATHTRWRLFWATYSMERVVTLTYHQPFAIREDQIRLAVVPPARLDTPPDTPLDTSVLTGGGGGGGHPVSGPARYLTHLAYCQLQTEISDVNVNNEPIQPPTRSYAEWTAVCERRVEALRGADWREAFLIPDWRDLPALRALAWLYMPCPRNPRPSDETVAKFVRTLLQIVDTYWAVSQSRVPHIILSVVHHAYEVGTQLLYCMQTYPHIVEATAGKADLAHAMARLSELFTALEERWPAASQCKMLLERLSPSILAAFMQDQPPNTLDDTPSDEQRVVDLILRKNSCFFFAKEEVLDIQSYLAESFTHPSLQLDLDDAASSVHSVLASFDLLSGTFLPSDPAGDSLLEWPPALAPNWISEAAVTTAAAAAAAAAAAPPTDPPAASKTASRTPPTAALSAPTRHVVDTAQQTLANLPVCTYCRLKRIRCSRILPSCHNCQDYGKDCLYVEASTGKPISGRYLYGLQQRLSDVLRELNVQNAAHKRSLSSGPRMCGDGRIRRGPQTLLFEYDTPYGPSACYWGESSILGQLLSAALPCPKRALPDPDRCPVPLPRVPHPDPSMAPLLRSLEEMSPASLAVLVERYLFAVETFLPILGRRQLDRMLDTVGRRRHDPAGTTAGPSAAAAAATADRALLHLVVAVSLAVPFGGRAASAALADHYLDAGMRQAAATGVLFVASSIASLQCALLVCVYVRLRPTAGSLPRLVSTACRLCLDLLESQDLSVAEMATLHVLFRTAYVLDTDAAVDLGRPNVLPEWKTSDKMLDHATAADEKGRIALLAYHAAKLRAAIHTIAAAGLVGDASSLSSSLSSSSSTRATLLRRTLRGQLDDWWDEWARETSAQSAAATITSLATTTKVDTGLRGGGDDCHTGLFLYGSFLYFQTASLLRLLGEGGSSGGGGGGTQEEATHPTTTSDHGGPWGPPSSHAASLINTHAAFQNLAGRQGREGHRSAAHPEASVADYGFPIGWSHYKDLFGAGLELLAADGASRADPAASQTLESCYDLLRLFETCIGTRDWVLSEQLRILMQA